MNITGYKYGVDSVKAIQSLNKHSDMSLPKARQTIEKAIDGNIISLRDDFVLREDLEDAGFIIE